MDAETDEQLPGTSGILLAVGLLSTLAVVTLVLGSSTFLSDDFRHFALVLERPFWEQLVTPIDVHFAPLHRAASYLIYTSRPLDFSLAVFVLLGFHVAGTLYLYATLQALRRTSLNRVLILLYATNVFLFVPFLWWSSGIHRFPYILCAVACLYHYVRYRDTRSRGQLLAVVGFLLAGVGFYTKAFLIPVYLFALEICLLDRTSPARARRNLLVVGSLALASAIGFQLSRGALQEHFAALNFPWTEIVALTGHGLKILGDGLLTDAPPALFPAAVTLVVWVALFGYSVAVRPSNGMLWLVGLAVIALNLGVVATSARSEYGLFMAYSPRLYFELTFLVVLFGALILHRCMERRSAGWFEKGVPRQILAAGLAALAVGYAISSYSSASALLETRYAKYLQAREFMENLSTGLEELSAAGQEFSLVDETLPRHVSGLARGLRYSILLPILGVKGAFEHPTAVRYRVDDEGRLILVPPPGAPASTGPRSE